MQAVKAAKRHPQLLQKAHADSLLLARFTWSLFPAAMPGFLFKRPTRLAGCLGSVAEVLSLRFPPNASPELNNLGLASSLPCGWLVTGSNGENRAERRALSGVPIVTIRLHRKSLRRCSLGRRRSTTNIR